MQASVDAAQATLKQAQWQLAQTEIQPRVSGWVTNLTTTSAITLIPGNRCSLVDSHSFYVIGYFEETKLRHIREEGVPAQITLYSDK